MSGIKDEHPIYALDGSGEILPDGNIRAAARGLAAAVAQAGNSWSNAPEAQRQALIAMISNIEFIAGSLGLDLGQRQPLIALGQALQDLENGVAAGLLKPAANRTGRPLSKTWQARAYLCAAADALTREKAHYRAAGLQPPETVLSHKEAARKVAEMYLGVKSEHLTEAKQIAEWRDEFQRMRVPDEDAGAIWDNCRKCMSSGGVAPEMAKAWVERSQQIERLW